ncbi:MAG: HU family DNA-binding protein [Methylophilus sp.]|uniref:HU family DNA-binding protein n=1 Tax=Methylophilus sp. TaxID=29541 RepID=UPI003F9FDF75
MVIKDLIDLVHEDIDGVVKKSDLDAVLSSFLRNCKEQLLKGEPLVLKNFGTLSVEVRKAHLGRNFRTAQSVSIPERKIVKFTAGVNFSSELKGK